ncbi:MAG: gliding motility-associated C-terminal domain-containing protein, partial [Cytophagales bacterium]|nr:gliding motility-associated C-terminal domain-containing protein [Cytophagales bacterium]
IKTFTIPIVDSNDPPQLFSDNFSVKENSPIGTLVGIIRAEDPEGEKLSYGMLRGIDKTSSTLFDIDPSSGKITVMDAQNLDYERIRFEEVYVMVSDNQKPALSDTALYRIEIENVEESSVPANIVLTPNGDGINDFWRVENVEFYQDLKLVIMNSYGQTLYEAKPYRNDWDGYHQGKPLSRGSYHYFFLRENGKVEQKGTISILR